jgi:hypothetical protein
MNVDPKSLSGEARRRYDTWRTLGLSEAAAIEELRCDGLVEEDGFDRAVRRFVRLGMSESAARTAAVGRMSEAEARRGYGAASGETSEEAADAIGLNLMREIVEVREQLRDLDELQRVRFAREDTTAAAQKKRRQRE